jgi:hypothetical protein
MALVHLFNESEHLSKTSGCDTASLPPYRLIQTLSPSVVP